MYAAKTSSDSVWTRRPEIPTSAEMLDEEPGNSSSTSDIIEMVPNKRHGAWESKGKLNSPTKGGTVHVD